MSDQTLSPDPEIRCEQLEEIVRDLIQRLQTLGHDFKVSGAKLEGVCDGYLEFLCEGEPSRWRS